MALYVIEATEDINRSPDGDQDNPEVFIPIIELTENLYSYFKALGQFIRTETRQPREGELYTDLETRLYNLHPARLKPYVETILMPSLNLDPTWKLCALLFEKADSFNERSDVLHVEDVLISKRVVILDEWYIVNRMLQDSFNPKEILDPDPAVMQRLDEGEHEIDTRLQRISEINRLRRNKLLLNDWSGSRPWKQLYIMYDTSLDQELATIIEQFWTKMESLDVQYPNPHPGNPSNKANIWRHLFQIHPLDSAKTPSDTRVGEFYDGDCAICMDSFDENLEKMLVRLHCDHWFHFECWRRHMDLPNMISFLCPYCKRNWRLHDHTGITPETKALDVWDYEEVASLVDYGDPPRPTGPNLTLQYFQLNDEMVNMSLLWSSTTGYPIFIEEDDAEYQVAGNEFRPGDRYSRRSPSTEMALFRKMRRDRNERWRSAIEAANMGYYGLDPILEDEL